MMLSDKRLKELLADGTVTGSSETFIGPASLDVRLGKSYTTIDPKTERIALGDHVKYKTKTADTLVIQPGQLVLATTMETFNLTGNLAAFVQGRSSIGRTGLSVQNAGFVDPGFKGQITLELVNESGIPIELKAGYRVAQIVFFETTEVEKPYSGKYNGQIGATGSRMWMDFEED